MTLSPDAEFQQARAAHRAGRLAVAAAGYRRLLRRGPGPSICAWPWPMRYWAWTARPRRGTCSNRWWRARPGLADARMLLADASMALGDFDSAAEGYRLLLDGGATSPVLWSNLGCALQALDDTKRPARLSRRPWSGTRT